MKFRLEGLSLTWHVVETRTGLCLVMSGWAKGGQFFLLNNEQIINWLGVEHFPDKHQLSLRTWENRYIRTRICWYEGNSLWWNVIFSCTLYREDFTIQLGLSNSHFGTWLGSNRTNWMLLHGTVKKPETFIRNWVNKFMPSPSKNWSNSRLCTFFVACWGIPCL